MAVYKGLDILTAKPTDVMQAQVKYYGLDIAETDQNFSIIDYLNYLIDQKIPEKSFHSSGAKPSHDNLISDFAVLSGLQIDWFTQK